MTNLVKQTKNLPDTNIGAFGNVKASTLDLKKNLKPVSELR